MLFHPDRRLTLGSFIPRKGNQWARAAGIQFIGAQQAQPDTLIVAGRQGSGKSHLMHALANFAKKNEAIRSIACMTAVHFAEEVMRGAFYGDLNEVLRRYAKEGLLAIDDVDRILFQPVIADALLIVMRMRQTRRRRTLLTVTMHQAPTVQHPLTDFLDSQPAVRLI